MAAQVVNRTARPEFESPLTAAPLHLDRRAVLDGTESWTWRRVHTAARALARQFDTTATVCNLCDSRLGFLVVWLAAVRKGCLQLLPPSSGRADLSAMLRTSVRPTVVVDHESALKPEWRDHAQCLVWQPDSCIANAGDAELRWSPDWQCEQIRLYTSGSTGVPERQVKTLGQLALGAQLLGARLNEELDGALDALSGLGSLICSVPPQHMFGLEASVMLPLLHGIAILERRPLLPADVQAAFEECDGGAAWITTPLHLRSLQRAGESLPNCRAVVASTMPLAAELAVAAEQLTGAPVIEIYGSTETGALATRRTARSQRWIPLSGIRLERTDDGCRAWGSHFTSPRQLPDLIAVGADASFQLLGRHADMIKVAGRRASLAGLNQLLQELPGLEDGVLYMPSSESPTERLVLIHAGEALDRTAAEAWLRERMDPVFVPRAFIAVDRLPRSASGKLPREALDRIFRTWRTRELGLQRLEFDFSVPADHPSLPGHFPGNPVVPGVLLLEAIVANLERATGCRTVKLQQVKFLSVLRPDEHAIAHCEVRGDTAIFHAFSRWGSATVPLASGTISLATCIAHATHEALD